MNIELFLYLCNVADNAAAALFGITFILCVYILIRLVHKLTEIGDEEISYPTKAFIILLFVIFFDVFIPDSKTMYLMLGANVLKKSSLPQKVINIVNNKLDEILDEQTKLKGKDK